jgi:hypothetical protein
MGPAVGAVVGPGGGGGSAFWGGVTVAVLAGVPVAWTGFSVVFIGTQLLLIEIYEKYEKLNLNHKYKL